ncbi:ATP-dependent endonuclease [Methylobacterium sp. Leaf88]|uniref:ATP-dependent nuclease n=1 Tax=Methylobacterium sp. Leaf88 TaxID=1736244 RepID=UPI0009E9137C|nr:ATP-dependent endonuclease [Methylobacterium sp. Leaf88]
MRVKKVRVQGFRLLRDIELILEDTATVVVGRNNSGKTSLTDVFRCFGASGTPFRLQDFSAAERSKFLAARDAKATGVAPHIVLEMLPKIAITLTLAYDKAASDIGPMSAYVIDLDADSDTVIAHIVYAPRLAGLSALLECDVNSTTPDSAAEFFRHIKQTLGSVYDTEVWAIDPTADENRRLLDVKHLHSLIKWDLVRAQRTLDHSRHADADVIGKLLNDLYKTAKAPTATAADQALAAQLKLSVEEIERKVQNEFGDVLTELLPAMDVLGFPGQNDSKLKPETVLNVEALLNDHTKIVYASNDGVHLPEGYNGLGTRNLIYMLLQLQTFHKEYRALETQPNTHLIFIEEPEAHLHPQMQEVFIAQLNQAVAKLSEGYPDDPAWRVQFIITTHSPHVANAATFEAVRYFLNDDPAIASARQTKIKDFKKGLATIPEADRDFLHQYMTLTKCDLYFADKAIMVEGTTERILVPRLCALADKNLKPEHRLERQYVTTLEVGGAYAHLFYPLIDFLELKTLVITDIDSVHATKTDKGHVKYKKCLVVDGERTSNSAIRHWFDKTAGKDFPQIKPLDLIAKPDAEKISRYRRIAFQIPESSSEDACARSFEDALILANPSHFHLPEDSNKALKAWELAKGMEKAATALQFAIREKDWIAPRYIREGLAWLAEPPPPPTEPPLVVPEENASKASGLTS